MRPQRVDVRIRRVVVDRPAFTAPVSMSHAIRSALEAELSGGAHRATGIPQAIAGQIAERVVPSGGRSAVR